MKVLLINGSHKTNGNTFTALNEIAGVLNQNGIETEILQIGTKPVQDCIACGKCENTNQCIFHDIANEWTKKMEHADGVVFGTPVYYGHASGRLLSLLDRMFYSNGGAFEHKVAASVSVARRAGNTSALDDLNKYIFINNMIGIGSSYWNLGYGRTPDEILQDEEGLQTMRNLGLNMAWILKSIEAGKGLGIEKPKLEEKKWTNFIR